MVVDLVFDYLTLEFEQFFLKVFVYLLLLHLWVSPVAAAYPSFLFWIIKNLCDFILWTKPFFKKKEENIIIMIDSFSRAYYDLKVYYNNDIQINIYIYEFVKKIKVNEYVVEKNDKQLTKTLNLNDISIYCLQNKFSYLLNKLINNYQLFNINYPLLLDLFFMVFSFIIIFLFFTEKISYNKQIIVFLFYGSLICIKIGYYLSFLLSFAEVWVLYFWRLFKWVVIKLLFC